MEDYLCVDFGEHWGCYFSADGMVWEHARGDGDEDFEGGDYCVVLLEGWEGEGGGGCGEAGGGGGGGGGVLVWWGC